MELYELKIDVELMIKMAYKHLLIAHMKWSVLNCFELDFTLIAPITSFSPKKARVHEACLVDISIQC